MFQAANYFQTETFAKLLDLSIIPSDGTVQVRRQWKYSQALVELEKRTAKKYAKDRELQIFQAA